MARLHEQKGNKSEGAEIRWRIFKVFIKSNFEFLYFCFVISILFETSKRTMSFLFTACCNLIIATNFLLFLPLPLSPLSPSINVSIRIEFIFLRLKLCLNHAELHSNLHILTYSHLCTNSLLHAYHTLERSVRLVAALGPYNGCPGSRWTGSGEAVRSQSTPV